MTIEVGCFRVDVSGVYVDVRVGGDRIRVWFDHPHAAGMASCTDARTARLALAAARDRLLADHVHIADMFEESCRLQASAESTQSEWTTWRPSLPTCRPSAWPSSAPTAPPLRPTRYPPTSGERPSTTPTERPHAAACGSCAPNS
jgi:hypothetical protein